MIKVIGFLVLMVAMLRIWSPAVFAQTCDIKVENAEVTMTLDCLRQGAKPDLWFEEVVNLVRPYIDSIQNIYNTQKNSFEFEWSLVNASKIASLDTYKNRENKLWLYRTLLDPSKTRMVKVPLAAFAYDKFKGYGFSAADRDISNYWECAKQNFMVGMRALEDVVVGPWKVWNANQAFAHLEGYCMGSDKDKYMFYQWICGVSSMAFRASLLDSKIEIAKRANHSKRYTTYYGEEVVGDDASLYENLKQFEIKNNSDYPLLIKSKIIWKHPYLVFIHPESLEQKMLIYKQQTGPLTAQISRIWTEDGLKKSQVWKSKYMEKTAEAN